MHVRKIKKSSNVLVKKQIKIMNPYKIPEKYLHEGLLAILL